MQGVVPRDLLSHYLGMMDPSCAVTVDTDVTRQCAYSLPAVAFTLGRQNWSALRSLYLALSADVQVRELPEWLYYCFSSGIYVSI